MPKLWANTLSLLRRHPRLWLPVLLADLASFWLSWLARILRRAWIGTLVARLTQSHSVLGDTPDQTAITPAMSSKVVMLAAPIEWANRYLGICLYTAAFIATAAIVYTILSTREQPRTPNSAIRAERSRILIFALKFFALNAIVGVLGSWLLSWSLHLQAAWEKSSSNSSLQTSLESLNLPVLLPALLLACGVAIIMAPIAVKLLLPPGTPIAPQQAKSSRRAALFIVVLAALIQVLVQQAEPYLLQHLGTTTPTLLTVGLAVSLLTALPFIPLYVALALIAAPRPSAATS